MNRKTVQKLLILVVLISARMAEANSQTRNEILIQTTAWYRAETTVPELSGLTIEDCVKVLNLKTDYQVNLELREYATAQPQHRFDLSGLRTQSIEQVLSKLLGQTGEYVFLKTNKTINLVPKNRLSDTNYVFNTVLQAYEVKDQNLVGAWELLCHRVPALVIRQPVFASIEDKPKEIAEEKNDARAGSPFSLNLRNASVRSVVNALARKFGESYWSEPYWIAQPSPETSPKWQWIIFYQKSDGKYVLWEHDPGLREQRKQYMEGDKSTSR